MNVGRVVFWAVLWIGAAVYVMASSEPIPRWLVAVLCASVAFVEVAGHIGERITAETARIEAISDALRALGGCARAHDRAGEPEKAIAVLDAASAVGKLTDKAPS